jgi:hypothetical protein
MRAGTTVAPWLGVPASVGVEISVANWVEDPLQSTISVYTLYVLTGVVGESVPVRLPKRTCWVQS